MKVVLKSKWVLFTCFLFACFAVVSVKYDVEPATNVRFPKELMVPGCSDSLVLLGTGLSIIFIIHFCFELIA